ncbi:hypothetical protein [Acetobacterium bakii]|nr:hypothetical protein [Acetobacterium bakii]
MKAVKLLIQYDMSYSTVVRELGYPSKEALWCFRDGSLSRNGSLAMP